ncbi:MAG: hypothetical protein HXY23_08745 [Parvularculaceae bacterium]|nr:hypothetical protein [Parvularculaceae bacterium]
MVLRLVFFLVGVLGLIFVGLNAASGFGVDTNALLMKLGQTPGSIATGISGHVGAGLDQLGNMIAKAQGADVSAEDYKPSLLVKYGPDVAGAVVSALLMMFGMRR